MKTLTATTIAMLLTLMGATKAHELYLAAQADASVIQADLTARDAFIESLFEEP